MRSGIIAAGMLVVCGGAWTFGHEPRTAELRGNQWVEVAEAAQASVSPDPRLDRIEQLLDSRRHGEARKRLAEWFKQNRASLHYDRALYLMAEGLYLQGNRIKAFYYLDQLLDEHPESPLFYLALEKQYQIANPYLNGYKRRLLMMPILGAKDEAVDMLFRIQQRSPGSPLAEKALLRTADHYFAEGDYDLAADAYAWYAREYPRSPAIARVKLRRAFSNYAQFRGLRFDATPLVDARAQLAEMMALYPEVAEEERLAAVVERIDRTFAEKLLTTADFYRRTNEPVAAVYHYRYLLSAYPDTPEAERAQQALARMPERALESPPPGAPAPEPGGTSITASDR